MSTNGQLVFTDVDKITFKGVGNTSNAVVDTLTGKIGVGIDSPDANLHVLGNSYVSTNLELGGTLIMGTVNVSAHHSLEAVTAEGNTTPVTVEFQNADTSLVTMGNVEVGGELTVSGNVFFTSNVTTSVDSNVVMEHAGPHGRLPKAMPLRKYPEIVFDASKLDGNDSTNTYVQAGCTVSASSDQSQYNLNAWRIFDGVKSAGTGWVSQDGTYYDGTSPANSYTGTAHQLGTGTAYGEWLKLELPKKIKVSKFILYADPGVPYGTNEAPKSYKIYGSVTGSSWTELKDVSNETPSTNGNSHIITDTTAYRYVGIVVTQVNTDQDNIRIGELEFYGHEEDPPTGDTSINTTFKSVLNTPQTTGANVYVDGNLGETFTNRVTGPTPTGTATTYNETGKYWELTGALTSNVTVEGNTFLEGDQPHAVSVWFNSSNLEANTANTCVFTISDQENLDSYNLDLQSNTWHNLTYSYQGEGGSRVTYLDGRKVSEDQAEDTFGDYPPFAMTGYSQGGYVVSASSSYAEGSYPAWEAFNNIWHNNGNTNGSDAWLSENAANYNGVDGLYSKSPPRNLGTGALDGEWVKIEMPHKFKLNYITIYPRYLHDNKAPRDFIVYGSNDNVNWSPVLTKTGASITSSHVETGHTFNVDVYDTCYKYFGLVIRKLRSSTTFVNIAELKLYGHRENDLVRLPDPTHVLKYPHVTLTEDARRGYVVSASGNHSNGNHPTWKAFDGDITNDWQINGGRYSNSGGVYTHNAGETTVTNVQSRVGDWVQLESPHKIRVKTMKFTPIATYGQERSPATGVLVGSNDDGSTWTEIKVFDVTADGTPTSYTAASSTILAIDSGSNSTPGYYKIHRLIWLTLYTASQTTYADRAAVADLEFYGTGVDSIPIQIGGGNIDRVANFRVYDRFVEEDQALEIWDAQKEEFGRAKSSMTLHKGRLGIGTDEPQGRLAVADEPDPDAYGLQEFPPRGMTEYETYIEEHGVFRASAGTKDASAGQAYLAFNKTLFERGWHGGPENDGRYTNSLYLGTLSNGGYLGDWIRLDLPYKVKLNSSLLYHRDSTSYVERMPKKGVILGSNDDGGSWELVHSWDNETYSAFQAKRFDINSNTYFKSFILVVQELVTTATLAPVNLSEWRLFGYREQVTKQSVLHDGQLTLTKNLTVPSIGPSVTDTRHVVPRRHRLVVEFDTSTNPTDLATVKDTSGMGNDGTLRPSAHYSIKEKAFVFDGSGDYIDTGVLSPSLAGAHPHSVSVWFKTNTTASGTLQFVTCLGEKNGTTGDRRFSAIRVYGSELQFWQWSNDLRKSGVISADVWYHVVAVYLGGGTSQSTMLMYLNGEQITSWNTDTTDGGVLGLVSPSFAVGEDIARSTYNFDGQISKPLVYDTDLTAAEVKTLYAMGRGDPYHVTNFQNTLVGINLGNGRAPRSALDVRDQIYARTSTVSTFTGQHKCVPEEPMETGLIVSAKKNQYVKLNGSLDTGKSAITIDESLPVVSLSSVAQDKACFGVVSSMEEANSLVRIETVGGVISDAPKTLGDNRAIVNSVGEGAIWIVNTGGPLESGDYITTSNVTGYGQKQDSDSLKNYTVAKITMDCDFEPMTQPIQIIKKDEEGENVLDEHGQLQWEDHPTETEKAYKVRYLTADGTQTEEANAVHIAAFVGCTYHCG